MNLLKTPRSLPRRPRELAGPSRRDLPALVRQRKATTFRFADDGSVPNHPRWPLVHYRGPVRLTAAFDPAAIFEELFERNGWADSWRNGVYDFLHFHSRVQR